MHLGLETQFKNHFVNPLVSQNYHQLVSQMGAITRLAWSKRKNPNRITIFWRIILHYRR